MIRNVSDLSSLVAATWWWWNNHKWWYSQSSWLGQWPPSSRWPPTSDPLLDDFVFPVAWHFDEDAAHVVEDVLIEYGVVALVLAHDVHLVGEWLNRLSNDRRWPRHHLGWYKQLIRHYIIEDGIWDLNLMVPFLIFWSMVNQNSLMRTYTGIICFESPRI